MVDDLVRGRVVAGAGGRTGPDPSGGSGCPTSSSCRNASCPASLGSSSQKLVATSLIGALPVCSPHTERICRGATRKQFIDYCVNMLLSTAATYAPHCERGESEHSIPAGLHN